MCMLKSAIILKNQVYMPDHNHHTQMLEELEIKDTRQNAETKFIRAELIPPNGDMFSPVDTWTFKVDQDIIPDWYVGDYDRNRMIDAVNDWAKEHIHIDESDFTIGEGTYYLKNCKRVACHNSTVEAYDNSTVKAWGNSTVKAWGNAIAFIPEYSSAKRESVVLMENSTLKDCKTKTIYQSGSWELVIVNG